MAKIMVADDSRTSRKMLLDIISPIGFSEIIEAVDGEDAVQKYQEFRPEVVTLDITMPKMDGIEVLTKIMELEPKTKVVMVTAAAQNSKIMEAVKLGASEFIAKPYEAENVSEMITKLLKEVGA